jgi:hypothetical protein
MKCLEEPLSRLANCQYNARGESFEERFKNVAILDEESLLQADYTGRLFRDGKAVISAGKTSILERVGVDGGNSLVATGFKTSFVACAGPVTLAVSSPRQVPGERASR